jgi:F-type H+/Na+-transporting ATPase subunit beta
MSQSNQGTITQIIGPVIDVEFAEGELPAVYHALKLERSNGQTLT